MVSSHMYLLSGQAELWYGEGLSNYLPADPSYLADVGERRSQFVDLVPRLIGG